MSNVEVEEETARIESTEAAMRTAGVATHEPQQQSYFGFERIEKFTLPDGVSYIEFHVLNEGKRKMYLDAVQKDVRLQKTTGDAFLKLQSGTEKHVLLEAAICGWNLIDETGEVRFSPRAVKRFLDETDPRLIDLIEKEVRKANPWLLADMSADDIRKQIDDLEEMLEVKEAEEAGKGS